MPDSSIPYESHTGDMDDTKAESDGNVASPPLPRKSYRNLIGFWLLGLCNNYGYVIMLSAAFDFLHPNYHGDDDDSKLCVNGTNSTGTICNPVSTGAILLADILPTLFIKLVAPFIVIGTHYRVFISVTLSCMCFLITSFSSAHWMTFIGVISASLSSGLGEITFLSYSSFFDKNVVSTWSSGTGAAGVIGALSYASLTHVLSPKNTLLVMLIVPIIMSITFWILLEHPPSKQLSCKGNFCGSEMQPMLHENVDFTTNEVTNIPKFYTFQEKINLVKPLLKYMVPLGLVYFAEYFINQGLMELLYFPNECRWLSHKDQYRWYQVDYQFGVLISRSSVNLFKINRLWLLPVLQFVNVILLLMQVRFPFIPSIWIVLIIIFYEGLLGGGAYVNTFYKISTEVSAADKEFSMGIASLADSMGIALAGIASLPVHDALCNILSGAV